MSFKLPQIKKGVVGCPSVFSKIVLSALVLFHFSVMAASKGPNIGDAATFDGIFTPLGGGTGVKFELAWKVLDKSKDKIWLEQRVLMGSEQKQVLELELDAFPSEDELRVLVAQCALFGGQSQKIKVPAGEFASCLMEQVDEDGLPGSVWLGEVPFGIIQNKTQNEQGNTVLRLKNFTRSRP